MSASGTSVLGFQTLEEGPADIPLVIKVLVGNPTTAKPRRVGYFYVIQFDPGDELYQSIVWRGPVYIPGQTFVVPEAVTFTNYQYRLRVNWNESGLNWLSNFGG